MQLDHLKLRHNFVVVDRLVVPVILEVHFQQQNGLAVDFTTKAVTVRSSSMLDTALGHGSSLPRIHGRVIPQHADPSCAPTKSNNRWHPPQIHHVIVSADPPVTN